MGVDARGARSSATKDASVGARRTTSFIARRRRRCVVVVVVVVVARAGDRPNDTLARGANALDEGGDFLPRVE